MPNTKTTPAAVSVKPSAKEISMSAIEREHFDQCLWQLLSSNRRIVVECMSYGKAKGTAIVVKHYNKPIPRSVGDWPEMLAAYVYLPLDSEDSMTWAGLDAALTAYEKQR